MVLNLNNNEVTGVDLNGTEVSEVRLNGQTVFSAGADIPDSEDWQTPTVAFDNSRDGDANLAVDDSISTYSVLKSEEDGYIDFSSASEYKKIRFEFDGTSGDLDVTLQPSGTVLKEGWDVSNNQFHVISLEEELGKEAYKTDENYRVQIDDTTNKRIAETDVDVNV
jgi:hypothetical protein